ncbi:MAG: hypothetical protein ACOZJX_10515 [Pseudomonadota bacterium]
MESEARKAREDQAISDAHYQNLMDSIKREGEQYQDAMPAEGGVDRSDLAAMVAFGVIAGTLLFMSRTPERPRPAEDYTRLTERHRQDYFYRRCTALRNSSLVVPRYEPPSILLNKFLGPSRKAEHKEAMAKYEAALKESNGTCKCVGARAASASGFSEREWAAIAARGRAERPWLAVEEPRVREVFDACAGNSPSDPRLSWMYAAMSR